jgi:hypothetical protein
MQFTKLRGTKQGQIYVTFAVNYRDNIKIEQKIHHLVEELIMNKHTGNPSLCAVISLFNQFFVCRNMRTNVSKLYNRRNTRVDIQYVHTVTALEDSPLYQQP